MSEKGYQAASLTYHTVMNVHMTGKKNHSGGSLQIKPLKHANKKTYKEWSEAICL